MAMMEEKGAAKAVAASERVQIDGRFVREQANTAVRQFFAPITAPFRFAAQTFATQEDAVKAAQELGKRHR